MSRGWKNKTDEFKFSQMENKTKAIKAIRKSKNEFILILRIILRIQRRPSRQNKTTPENIKVQDRKCFTALFILPKNDTYCNITKQKDGYQGVM